MEQLDLMFSVGLVEKQRTTLVRVHSPAAASSSHNQLISVVYCRAVRCHQAPVLEEREDIAVKLVDMQPTCAQQSMDKYSTVYWTLVVKSRYYLRSLCVTACWRLLLAWCPNT